MRDISEQKDKTETFRRRKRGDLQITVNGNF